MKKNIASFFLVALTTVSICAQSASTTPMTAEESVSSKILGKVLASIDYSKTTFNLNLFEGSFSSDDKNKSNIDIQNLNANLDLYFKDGLHFSPAEFVQNMPKDPRAKAWIPNINLNLKDYRIKSSVVTEPTLSKTEKVFNIKINFQKNTGATDANSYLKIQVGNELNQNLINLNLI